MNARLGTLVAVAAASTLGGAARAQGPATVELRIVPRLGYSRIVSGYEAIYDLAVQARVSSVGNAYGLSAFGFNLRIAGESEAAGTLWRGGITLADGTYDPTIWTGDRVGRTGIARQYSYLASLNQNFNGVINFSAVGFTNTPDQEIGLIVGSANGFGFMTTPGMDDDFDGQPDSDPLGAELMGSYFAGGEFVDLYRFRYGLRSNTGRTLSFRIEGVSGVQAFNGVRESNGLWGPDGLVAVTGDDLVVTGLDIPALPSPGAAGWVVAMAGMGLRRRRNRG